jgi:hypothetical protein
MHPKLKWIYTSLRCMLVLVCLLVIPFTQPGLKGLADPAATFIRVAATGADSAGCGSEVNPCRTIQYAVNKAEANNYILTVAEGVYTYNPSADPCSWAITPAVVCIVDKNITILGGYTTSNWYISDPARFMTVIDGQNSVRGAIINQYNSTASLVMDGFTIQNGLAHGNNTSDDYNSRGFGGGIWSQRAPMTLSRMILRNNRAIGGNRDNTYGGFGAGGGIAIEAGVNANIPVSMDDMLFENNQVLGGSGGVRGGVALGGGIFAYNGYIELTDAIIRNNLAQSGNSGGSGFAVGLKADALGGGVALQIDSSANFTRVQITDNQAIGGNAGAVSGSQAGSGLGGGLYIEEAPATINDTVISGNIAVGGNAAQGGLAFGGGMMINYANVTIDGMQLIHNLARSGGSLTGGAVGEASGGGLMVAAYDHPGQGHLSATNCVFADNQVEAGTPGSPILASGAGITIQAVTVDIVHSTLVNNQFLTIGKAGQAISIFGSEGPGGVPATVNISYSIISDHINSTISNGDTSALTVYTGSTANLHTVMFYRNTNNTNSNGKPVSPGTINQVNSLFSNTPIRYVSPGSPNFNYHIQSSSPARDQAVSSTTSDDMDNQPRPFGPARDIGADEYFDVNSTIYLPLTLR